MGDVRHCAAVQSGAEASPSASAFASASPRRRRRASASPSPPTLVVAVAAARRRRRRRDRAATRAPHAAALRHHRGTPAAARAARRRSRASRRALAPSPPAAAARAPAAACLAQPLALRRRTTPEEKVGLTGSPSRRIPGRRTVAAARGAERSRRAPHEPGALGRGHNIPAGRVCDHQGWRCATTRASAASATLASYRSTTTAYTTRAPSPSTCRPTLARGHPRRRPASEKSMLAPVGIREKIARNP